MLTAHMVPQIQPPVTLTPNRRVWLHLILIAALMISRRPDAILHPQFWAEDGQLFFHDAYIQGWPVLLHPLKGYLQTLPLLIALVTTHLKLLWAPAIYVTGAAFCQLLPVWLLLSRRLDPAFPSWSARLALAYFYAGIPNSYDLNFNLTDAQWHLAIAAFLLAVAKPNQNSFSRIADVSILLLSGISGPFGIFLVPIAWYVGVRQPGRASLCNAAVITGAAAIQLAAMLVVHGQTARFSASLGAGLPRLLQILTNQIFLGGIIGSTLMQQLLAYTGPAAGYAIAVAATAVAIAMLIAAWCYGRATFRAALLWSAMLFATTLMAPIVSDSGPQWERMTHPGAGVRYYEIPTLVWFATSLVLLGGKLEILRAAGAAVLALAIVGVCFSWPYPAWQPTGFTAEAMAFDAAPPGTTFTFLENPIGWRFTLMKH